MVRFPYGWIRMTEHTEKYKALPQNFFDQDVKIVARELLGCRLCIKLPFGNVKKQVISETEAYDGESDLACHASKGRTKRTAVMYGESGHCYVYLCYGIHWLLNVVTGAKGYPAAVLIRGSEEHLGPGILTKSLGVDGSFNGTLLSPKNRLWIEPREGDEPKVRSGPRVGVDYAGEHWSKVPYRFWFSKG